MIDESKLNEVLANLKLTTNDEAFQGAMPAGDCVLVSVATEPKKYNEVDWYPVTFQTSAGTYELSLKGLLQAEGLSYKSRNLAERIKAWYALNDSGKTSNLRKFSYGGKKEREITYRSDTVIDGVKKHKGEKGMMKYHTFANKLVG